MSRLRCGLIGFGAWGQHHARAISTVASAELTCICVRNAEGIALAAKDYPQAKRYADYREMLEAEDLDLVDVVLPSHLHHEVATAVLESGRHLLLEKPMALSLADCQAMIALARSKNLVLAIGHELRLSSLWGKVKELIDEDAIGEPLYCLIELWRRPYRLGAGGWRYDADRVGNWILEEPIHFFDLARWFFQQWGDPISVNARANGRQPGRPELHDNFSAFLDFAGGKYAVITQTLAAWEHHQIVKLTGTKGAISAAWGGAMDRTFEPIHSLKLQRGETIESIELTKKSGEVYELVDELEAVVASIQKGTPVPCTGNDGFWSTAMCLKAHESLESGQSVSLLDLHP